MHRLGKVAKEAALGELSCVGGGGWGGMGSPVSELPRWGGPHEHWVYRMLAPEGGAGGGTRNGRFQCGSVPVGACRETHRFVGAVQTFRLV